MEVKNNKNEYAKMVSLFLSELLRTRKIDFSRAGKIAKKVIENINLIDNEKHFLNFVKEISREFEEISVLKEKVERKIDQGQRKDLENRVQAFAANIMTSDMMLAKNVMDEAMREGVTMIELTNKFPKFKEYVDKELDAWTISRN